jgi:hypothetical protein
MNLLPCFIFYYFYLMFYVLGSSGSFCLTLLVQLSVENVATLTLGSWPRGKGLQECGTRGKLGRHILYSWECRRMWENEPSHSQMNSHFESWSPNGFLNFQRAISGDKTHWIEDFFISLERYWNVNVWNGLAWLIWTLKTQVMAKKRLGVELTVWLPTIKSRESTQFPCM